MKSFFKLLVLEFQDTQARNEILTLSFEKMSDLLFSSAILIIILMNSSDAKVLDRNVVIKEGQDIQDERPAFAIEHGSDPTLTKLKLDGVNVDKSPLLKKLTDTTNIGAPDSNTKSKETLLIWSIPQSGSELIRDILSSCHFFHIVDESAFRAKNKNTHKNVGDGDHPQLLNLSTFDGIQRAKDNMSLVNSFSSSSLSSPSKASNAIVTPLFLDSLMLLDDTHKGRAFAILRDPSQRAAERAVSNYHELIKDPHKKDMTLESYVKSGNVENNWMVRYLSGKIEGDITLDHLEVAKYVLDRKFIIGLYEELEESLLRFEKYAGVAVPSDYNTRKAKKRCRKGQLDAYREKGSKSSTNKKKKEVESIRLLLVKQNELDLELYNYAKNTIYRRQRGTK